MGVWVCFKYKLIRVFSYFHSLGLDIFILGLLLQSSASLNCASPLGSVYVPPALPDHRAPWVWNTYRSGPLQPCWLDAEMGNQREKQEVDDPPAVSMPHPHVASDLSTAVFPLGTSTTFLNFRCWEEKVLRTSCALLLLAWLGIHPTQQQIFLHPRGQSFSSTDYRVLSSMIRCAGRAVMLMLPSPVYCLVA